MKELLDLIEKGSRWQKKLFDITQNFLLTLEKDLDAGMDEIDHFVSNRQSLLNIIDGNTAKINLLLQEKKITSMDEKNYRKVESYVRQKESMLEKINSTDTKILKIVESVKSDGLKKLRTINHGKKVITNYKLRGVDSSEIDLEL